MCCTVVAAAIIQTESTAEINRLKTKVSEVKAEKESAFKQLADAKVSRRALVLHARHAPLASLALPAARRHRRQVLVHLEGSASLVTRAAATAAQDSGAVRRHQHPAALWGRVVWGSSVPQEPCARRVTSVTHAASAPHPRRLWGRRVPLGSLATRLCAATASVGTHAR
jgi:hypothetical protein